ncbi:MAG TPA: hypothetical protein VM733_17795 [Thermoanaerobaculia bacterium]|nr:hypothetical protein [Thermoanaerobaculia bacterium]
MRLLIGFLFAGTLLMWILWVAQREEGSSPRGPITATTVATGAGDLRVDIWIDKSRVLVGDPLTCIITVQNPTTEPVADFHIVTFSHEGLVPVLTKDTAQCWAGGVPSCIELDRKTVPGVPGELAAGKSVRIFASLRADEAGRSSIGGLFAWQGKMGSRSKSLIAAPVTVEKAYSAVGRATRNFIKELAFPLALALLGYLFKKAEDAQTRLRETWGVMFPLSHDRTEKHWMPLTATLGWMTRSHAEVPRRDDFCFFFLLRLWRQMIDASREVGGFFMKAHVTEEVLTSCWNVILLWSMATFGDEREQGALALSSRIMSYSEFLETYASRAVFRRLRTKYASQSENALALIASVARIFYETLVHEINRPYNVWYDDGWAKFDAESFEEAVALFRTHRDHLRSHSLVGLSGDVMETLRTAMDDLDSDVRRYLRFVVADRRRAKLGRMFAV